MKKSLSLLCALLCISVAWGQTRRAKAIDKPIKTTPIQVISNEKALKFGFNVFKKEQEKWFKFNRINLNLSEVAFSNWSAGGDNSFSAMASAKFRRRYSEKTYFWDNELDLNYGINAQKGRELRKTDDKISLTSSLGYRGNSDSFWYYTARFQFNSQISNGYAYPNTENPISKFMAPAYTYLGLGIEFVPDAQKFNMFLSPMTLKTTFVLDKKLADQGAFGVTRAEYAADGTLIKPGKKTNTELGFSVSGSWKQKIAKNMQMENNFNFYGDYLRYVGNIDVDLESVVNMKINDYVQARIGIHIKYDDDVKFYSYKEPNGSVVKYGARTQLKQVLGIGLSYIF